MAFLQQVISTASGLSSVVSTVALVWTIYYYRKQTELLKTQIDEMKKESSVQECLQLRDSTIRLHEVLSPLMLDEIGEIENFRDELNKVCSSPSVSCISYIHNLFSRPEEIGEFKEKISRILRDLNSLKVNDPRFKNYEEFVKDVYSSICNIPYSSSKGECELLEEIERMKNEYSEIIKLTDVPLINDIKGNMMKEIELGKEVGKMGIDDLFDVVDKFSFIIDGKCGDKTCKEVFPLRDVIEGKINPLKEMIENPKEFCKKYGLELGCDEYKPLLVKIREVVEDDEESKVFYSILYLNWISNQFKTMVNTIQLPSEIDIKVRMKAELERITCISS
jgi:predicted transcriptional regulator